MVINGTSNVKDWKAEVEEMDADIALNASLLEQDTMANPVTQFLLTIPVKGIESGKGGMNRKIYGALKEEDNPQITFVLKSAELTGSGQRPESFTLNASGSLTIAGTTKQVTFPVKAARVNENSFQFEGSYGLNMEDYGVDPPSAIFGTIRSSEEVKITFNVLLRANNN
jgi:polyisoprenoid-binding protein YceI